MGYDVEATNATRQGQDLEYSAKMYTGMRYSCIRISPYPYGLGNSVSCNVAFLLVNRKVDVQKGKPIGHSISMWRSSRSFMA